MISTRGWLRTELILRGTHLGYPIGFARGDGATAMIMMI